VKLRPIKVVKNYLKHAEGSCLISMGNTTVLCVASVEDKVPQFIEQKGLSHGWVTAEYSLLPRAGKDRTPRRRASGGGRSQEISRLIGRSLRGVVDLEKLGKRTIVVDCDVIRADGGTRTTSVNGGYMALYLALKKLYKEKVITQWPLDDFVGAISIGKVNGKIILDLCAEEDNNADVDLNLVVTGAGKIIEVQGTAEKIPFSRKDLDKMIDTASSAIRKIIKLEKGILGAKI
jgi:ribonuclease PH